MNRRRAISASCSVALTLPLVLLGGCGGDEQTADDSAPSPASDSTPAASADPTSPRPIAQVPEGPIEPGSYELSPLGPGDHPVAVVDIPEGYVRWSLFVEAAEPQVPDDPLALSLWVVTDVFKDACKATERTPAGDSVRTLAEAFVQLEGVSVTKPRAVTVAGYDGLYLEIAAPTKVDLSRCNEAELNFWEGRPTDGRWTRLAGMRDRLWILDIGGRTMTVAMFVPPAATDEQIDQLADIVEGMRFDRG